LVMLAEQEALLPVEVRLPLLHLVAQQGLLEQLLLQPQRHGHAEGVEAARREGEVGLEQPLELQERLVVRGGVVDVGQLDAGLAEAVVDRLLREGRVVLLAGEALFLSGGNELAVLDQRGSAVVIEGGDPQDPHVTLPRFANTYSGRPKSAGRNMPAATNIARARISVQMKPRPSSDGTRDNCAGAVPSERKSLSRTACR